MASTVSGAAGVRTVGWSAAQARRRPLWRRVVGWWWQGWVAYVRVAGLRGGK